MREVRLKKKKLTCLRCGKQIYSDIGHRFCRRCRRANREAYIKPTYRSSTS